MLDLRHSRPSVLVIPAEAGIHAAAARLDRLSRTVLRVAVFGIVCDEGEDEDDVYVPMFCYSLDPEPERPRTTVAVAPDSSAGRRRGGDQLVWSSGPETMRDVVRRPRRPRRRDLWWERRREKLSVNLREFADLSDGTRVVIRNDRGFTWGWGNLPSPWRDVTRQAVADDVRSYIDQVEDDRPASPTWIVETVRRLYEIELELASVQTALRLPRRIEFSDRLLRELSP